MVTPGALTRAAGLSSAALDFKVAPRWITHCCPAKFSARLLTMYVPGGTMTVPLTPAARQAETNAAVSSVLPSPVAL
jgi:hypothetical protein